MASSLSTKQFLGASISSDGAARLGFLQSPQMLPSPSLRLPARRSQSRHLGAISRSFPCSILVIRDLDCENVSYLSIMFDNNSWWGSFFPEICWCFVVSKGGMGLGTCACCVGIEIQFAGSTCGTYFCVATFGESHGGGVKCFSDGRPPRLPISEADMQVDLDRRKHIQKSGKKEHHLWRKRDSAGSGQKALNLVRTVSRLPNEKEVVYGALDKWIAWETEFPLIAAAKALRILSKGNQWKRIIQVAKWMLSKGQGATMATYDSLLLAFDMDGRVDEAEMLWDMILHAHNRSISKRLFSRMISLYDHHNVPDKVIEVFADMEELGVKPDQDTVRRVARAFEVLGQEDKHRLVRMKYQSKWKYIHFNGERVRVRL
ncbi:Pentatricopeptide repeat-containing protein, chloroplastic [Sesamum angolense]|uniref:chorismate synthase n=1 Tax=Sesamum angolense TaxID=2727404 RepID=A0AAE1W0Y3_9LAMI|nr:Pentatricopeptide repeat-containing protein, chloroplastic [Sesamum angolense]